MAEGYKGDETTGFASPAGDYIEEAADLVKLLDTRRPSRYALRVGGMALQARGIVDGDILVIDTALDPTPGKVCLVFDNGERLLAELRRRGEDWIVRFASGRVLQVAGDVEVWGIVTALVRDRV